MRVERELDLAVPPERLPGWLAEQARLANDGPLADDVAMLLLRPAAA